MPAFPPLAHARRAVLHRFRAAGGGVRRAQSRRLVPLVGWLYFELLANQQAEDNQHDVVLVNIDQATLDALGQKGVRANASYAALLEQLRQADSVVLGLNLTANRHLQQLLDAIKRHGRVVVAAPAYVGGDAPARIAAAAAGVGQRELLIGDGNVATGILPMLHAARHCCRTSCWKRCGWPTMSCRRAKSGAWLHYGSAARRRKTAGCWCCRPSTACNSTRCWRC